MELSNQNKNLCFYVETNTRNVHRFGVISHRNEFSTCLLFSYHSWQFEHRTAIDRFHCHAICLLFNSIALRQFYLQVGFIVCVCMHLFCRVLLRCVHVVHSIKKWFVAISLCDWFLPQSKCLPTEAIAETIDANGNECTNKWKKEKKISSDFFNCKKMCILNAEVGSNFEQQKCGSNSDSFFCSIFLLFYFFFRSNAREQCNSFSVHDVNAK